MTKRWNVLLAGLALSSVGFANGDAFARSHLMPISFTRSMDAFLGGKTSMWFAQGLYGWADGWTESGLQLAYGTRPDGNDYKGATLFAVKFNRWDPDAGSSSNDTFIQVCHDYTGKDDPYYMGVAAYYDNEEDWGKGMGAAVTIGTQLFGNDKDPGFMVAASANYAQWDPDAGTTTRGAGLSVNIARPFGDNMVFEYDHTFASKFGGAADWFARIAWDARPGTQVRFTVGKGEMYRFEVGWVVNTK